MEVTDYTFIQINFFLFSDKVLYAFYQVHLLKPPKKDSEIFQHHELYNINNKYIKNQQKKCISNMAQLRFLLLL